MTYQEIESLAKSLSYRDKLHLAQAMLQMARKEEEEQNSSTAKFAAEFPNIVERMRKSKPGKEKLGPVSLKVCLIFEVELLMMKLTT